MSDQQRLPSLAQLADTALSSISDEEAMLHVKAGKVEMLETLFNRYQGPLFNFFCKLTGDRGASEDLVQDVFFRILKYRETYRPGTSFRTWMYQIGRNARLDRWRKQRPELDDEMMDTFISPTQNASETVQQKQEVELLHRALMQLPEDKREVLILSRFQGMKYDEIGDLLDCETGTVKVRVFRALQDLKTIYKQLEQGG
jgi:RNA polymerase sigma factor (sigma-70 family)